MELTEKLRNVLSDESGRHDEAPLGLCDAAADEIDRLTRENAKIRHRLSERGKPIVTEPGAVKIELNIAAFGQQDWYTFQAQLQPDRYVSAEDLNSQEVMRRVNSLIRWLCQWFGAEEAAEAAREASK